MSICNIYKSPGEFTKPVFYTFSEYMNDLVVNINNDGMSIARPSRFLCLKLKDIKNNIENINKFLQNYYEDACCTLRDGDDNVTDYRKYLLGGLIHGLKGFIDTSVHDVHELVNNEIIEEIDINNIACEDIDLFGDGTIDGMKYDEIICYLNPSTSNNRSFNLDMRDTKTVNKSPTNGQYIAGYSRKADRILGDEYYESQIKPDAEGKWPQFPLCTISDPNSNSANNTSFDFNAVIVLYDITLGKDDNNPIKDIPLGIYINPNTITKYVNNNVIYNQGTSYALRIAMRFATTYDGSIYVEDTNAYDETRDISSLASVADRLSKTIDQMFEMTRRFNKYEDEMRKMITAIMNSSSTSKWKTYGDDRTYNNY